MFRIIIFFVCGLLSSQCLVAQSSKQLSSPDGRFQFVFDLSNEGAPVYSISYDQKPVVLSSLLGINGWERGSVINDVSFSKQDTVWKPVYGERSQVRDHYQGMIITLQRNNDENLKLQIQVRAYNEGIAFRYFFPENPKGGKDINIQKELTSFTVPEGTMAWFTNRAQGEYRLLPMNNWPSESERPLVLQLPGGRYACLAEAEMVNYSRTKFSLDANKPNTVSCSIYDRVDFFTPFATPWRVVMVAEHAGELLANNDLLLNLNPPCEIKNTSWIKPGKIIREMSLSMKGSKELIDFAVKRHLQYIHFDAGWYGYEYVTSSDATKVNVDPRRNANSDLDLQEVIRYANKKGIGVFLYVNQRALYKQLDEILPLFQKWGVRGIKFGFVEVGSHKWTTWLHEAIKKCAKYNLMVDIHDEYRPTGFSRTYPNLLTQEGVRGNEEMPDATNSTILPFTRFIAGAADHTICYYHRPELKPRLAETQNARVMKTTSGHQLALAVVFYSPLQFLYWYDKPEDSQDEPELEFFDKVSTVWDDTKVVDGEIGKHITIARRKGDDWFVGTVTNTEKRDLKIPLNFLMPGKKYEASIYYDDPASKVRTKISIKRIQVDATTILDTQLIASGGQAIWIKPLEK
ncbi:MAG TPA: glycoside hydrolase family 97 N-terminal domain-containing protein [Chitinophagaceae bacterium]|nr:glycoside hydrolase family 97 N-terminal domain-containing protein [Chitinophagaceae bacterium]